MRESARNISHAVAATDLSGSESIEEVWVRRDESNGVIVSRNGSCVPYDNTRYATMGYRATASAFESVADAIPRQVRGKL